MPHNFEALLVEGKQLVASGDIVLDAYKSLSSSDLTGISDDSLITGIMLQPDDLGPADAIERARIVQLETDGLITHEEAEAKLSAMSDETE